MQKFFIYREYSDKLRKEHREYTGDMFENEEVALECCKLLNVACGLNAYKIEKIEMGKECSSVEEFKTANKKKMLQLAIDYILNHKEFEMEVVTADIDYEKSQKESVKLQLSDLIYVVKEFGESDENVLIDFSCGWIEFQRKDLPKVKKIVKGALDHVEQLKKEIEQIDAKEQSKKEKGL